MNAEKLMALGLPGPLAGYLGWTSGTLNAAGAYSQADAAPISHNATLVQNVTGSADSVRLPSIYRAWSDEYMVSNDSDTLSLNVFPGIGDRISGYPVNEAIGIPLGSGRIFRRLNSNTWMST